MPDCSYSFNFYNIAFFIYLDKTLCCSIFLFLVELSDFQKPIYLDSFK